MEAAIYIGVFCAGAALGGWLVYDGVVLQLRAIKDEVTHFENHRIEEVRTFATRIKALL